MVVLFVLATRRTTAANAILLQYAAPIYVALLSGPLLGERVGARNLVLVGVCVLGVGLTFGGELGSGRAVGNLLAIVSGFGFAGLPIFLRRDQRKLPPELAAHAPLVAISLGNALAVLVALPAILARTLRRARPRCARQSSSRRSGRCKSACRTCSTARRSGASARSRARSSRPSSRSWRRQIWVVLVTGERPSALALGGGAVIVSAVVAQSLVRRPR